MIDGGLNKIFQNNLPGWHWQRVETGGTGRGIPDLNGCKAGKEIWIELKVADGWAVTLRPEQQGWLLRRARAGGNVFIAVRQKAAAGPRREKRDGLWLAQGALAAQLAQEGLRFAETLSGRGEGVWHWPGTPGAWSWDQIEQILTR